MNWKGAMPPVGIAVTETLPPGHMTGEGSSSVTTRGGCAERVVKADAEQPLESVAMTV